MRNLNTIIENYIMVNNSELIAQCEERAKQWLSPAFDDETRNAVQAMLENEDKTELVDAFYQNLEFGTGGLRGIMGVGTNRMNKYIVGMATQGFANYLLKAFEGKKDISVVVGHDCISHHRRRQLATRQHIITDTNLSRDEMLTYSVVNTLVVAT